MEGAKPTQCILTYRKNYYNFDIETFDEYQELTNEHLRTPLSLSRSLALRLSGPVFLVVSDDPKWCKEMLQAEDVVIIGK